MKILTYKGYDLIRVYFNKKSTGEIIIVDPLTKGKIQADSLMDAYRLINKYKDKQQNEN